MFTQMLHSVANKPSAVEALKEVGLEQTPGPRAVEAFRRGAAAGRHHPGTH